MQYVVVLGLALFLLLSSAGSQIVYESDVITESWLWSTTLEGEGLDVIVGLTEEQWDHDITTLPNDMLDAFPVVDFDQSMVIFVSLGQRSSGGFAVNIDRIQRDSSGLVITISRRSPGDDEFVSMALTYPYDLVIIPRLDQEQIVTIINRKGDVLSFL